MTLTPGKYTVHDTTQAVSPGATIAMRLAGESAFLPLSADSGAVAVTAVSGRRLTGRFVAWAQAPAGEPVLLRGEFGPVVAKPDTVRCEATASGVPAPDSV